MNWHDLKKRIRLGRTVRAGRFVPPKFALDLEPGFVAAARLHPAKRQVQSVGLRELPASVLTPSPNKSNLTDNELIREAIADVCERVGNGGGRLGLLIPDGAVRVALLQFESLPEDHRQAESLVVWRMREYLPYAPEEARLSYQVLSKQPGAVEVLSVAVRNSVLAEYEALLSGINGGPTLVLPASVALLPLLPEDSGGQLLLHLCPGALTAAVVTANRVRYWRTRTLEGTAASNLEEVAREATRVLATCQDNLNVQIENVWFCARPPAGPEVEQACAKALGRALTPLVADCLPPSGLPSGQRDTFNEIGMPFAGLVANQSQRR